MGWLSRLVRPKAGADTSAAAALPREPERTDGERRRHVRVPVELEVRVRFASSADLVRSRTLDLSSGGAFVALGEPRPIGTRVRLVLVVGDRTIGVGGVIVHSVAPGTEERAGMGIYFTDVGEEAARLIAEVVAARTDGT